MPPQNKAISSWLYACAALVFLMVIVGAITRLTESGLSITEWKPVTGALPPLNEAAWKAEFDLYKQSPQFQKENFWMELGDFKKIYFWEWFHRLLGRVIGAAYALPLLYFWVRKKIPPGYGPKFLGLLALGGLQGLMGWVMVQSGLVDHPAVSHYRLAVHLLLAFLIYAGLIAVALSLRPPKIHPHKILRIHAWVALGVFAITVCWGAFTAGLDAGLIYNDSFPKMGGRWIPTEATALLQLIENPAGVQFVHRWLAILTLLAVLSLWAHTFRRRNLFSALNFLAVMVVVQTGLGIATLLSGVLLPLAVLHQAGALVILTLLIVTLKQLAPR